MAETRKFLAIGYDSPPSPGFPIKIQEKGRQSTPGRSNKTTSKEGRFLVRREISSV